MPIFRVNVFEVEPGRVEEFLDGQRATAALQARAGGFTSRRVLQRLSGDTPLQTYEVHFEYPDWAAFAKFQAAFATDPDAQKAGAATRSNTDPAALMVESTFLTEVTL